MSGETNLDQLLRTMQAVLVPGVFVFAKAPSDAVPQGLSPRMMFQEAEATTLILLRQEAQDHKIEHEFPCRMITINVHSSLDAVGFIARIATALAAQGMGVNPVSGFYHDHLFVPDGRENDALEIIAKLARDAG